MKINEKSVDEYYGFAYDGCHKIYLLKSKEDEKKMKELGYELYKMGAGLIQCYLDSCSLRFIDLIDGDNITMLVPQFCEKVVFDEFDGADQVELYDDPDLNVTKDRYQVTVELNDNDEEC